MDVNRHTGGLESIMRDDAHIADVNRHTGGLESTQSELCGLLPC